MHEAGLMAAAVQQAVEAAERAGASRIERMKFAIASGGHVTTESVETLFAALSQGTIAEGAALAIETRPIRAYCPSCDKLFVGTADSTPGAGLSCPFCGRMGLPEAGTVELTLVDIDVPD